MLLILYDARFSVSVGSTRPRPCSSNSMLIRPVWSEHGHDQRRAGGFVSASHDGTGMKSPPLLSCHEVAPQKNGQMLLTRKTLN